MQNRSAFEVAQYKSAYPNADVAMETAVDLCYCRYTHQGCRWCEVCRKISL